MLRGHIRGMLFLGTLWRLGQLGVVQLLLQLGVHILYNTIREMARHKSVVVRYSSRILTLQSIGPVALS